MADQSEIPHATGRNGYDWDGYNDPGQLVDLWPSWIPFHTYRQRHVSIVAWFEGFRAVTVKDIPECPPKWTDVQHYWDGMSLIAHFAYFVGTKESWLVNILVGSGAIGIYKLATALGLLKILGV